MFSAENSREIYREVAAMFGDVTFHAEKGKIAYVQPKDPELNARIEGKILTMGGITIP